MRMEKIRNTYIIDPVCVQEQGHNFTAIKRYAHYLNKMDKEVICVVGKALPERLIAEDPDISWKRFFSHYYIQFIPLETLDEKSQKIKTLNGSQRCKYLEELSQQEFSKFSNEFNLSHSDTVFYPSVDYFSLIALVNFLKRTKPSQAPHFFIRWIAVMEHNMCNCDKKLEGLLDDLYTLKNDGHRITHSCESSSYAKYLSNHIKEDVVVTPTLVSGDLLKYPYNETFTISFPGAGRLDKGFSRIEKIIDLLNVHVPVKAIAQMLSGAEFESAKQTIRSMINDSRLVLLPAGISENVMKNVFASSNLVVAPYDKKVYELRSSAIVAETAMYGRPIVATPDCGFSKEIKELGLGDLAETDDEIVTSVINYTAKSYEELSYESGKIRDIFDSFTATSYERFFGELTE